MPAVPKRRTPRGRRDRRRANSYPTAPVPTQLSCDKCGELVLPYHVCTNCGTYRGRQVLKAQEE